MAGIFNRLFSSQELSQRLERHEELLKELSGELKESANREKRYVETIDILKEQLNQTQEEIKAIKDKQYAEKESLVEQINEYKESLSQYRQEYNDITHVVEDLKSKFNTLTALDTTKKHEILELRDQLQILQKSMLQVESFAKQIEDISESAKQHQEQRADTLNEIRQQIKKLENNDITHVVEELKSKLNTLTTSDTSKKHDILELKDQLQILKKSTLQVESFTKQVEEISQSAKQHQEQQTDTLNEIREQIKELEDKVLSHAEAEKEIVNETVKETENKSTTDLEIEMVEDSSDNFIANLLDYNEEEDPLYESLFSTESEVNNLGSVNHEETHQAEEDEEAIDIYTKFTNYMAQDNSSQSPEEEFVTHGLYMAEHEEEFLQSYVPFKVTMPTYKKMSIEQMKYYFYWRSNVRIGIYENSDIGYVILFAYELINQIGPQSVEEGHKQITKLLEHYKQTDKLIGELLSEWLYDYSIIFNQDSNKMIPSHKQMIMERLWSKDYSQITSDLNALSDYQVIKSKLYQNPKYQPIYDRVLKKSIQQIDMYLTDYSSESFGEKILGECKEREWNVFKNALINIKALVSEEILYKITEHLQYGYKNGRWYTTVPEKQTDSNIDIAYITGLLKYIEKAICKVAAIPRILIIEDIPNYMRKIVDRITEEEVHKKPGKSLREIAEDLTSGKKDLTPAKKTEVKITAISADEINEMSVHNLYYYFVTSEKEDVKAQEHELFQAASCFNELNKANSVVMIQLGNNEEFFKKFDAYLEWRYQLRRGIYTSCEMSFIKTYCFEIVNNIGVDSSLQGKKIIMGLIQNYGKKNTVLRDSLINWYCDYIIYYNCVPAEEFESVIEELEQYDITNTNSMLKTYRIMKAMEEENYIVAMTRMCDHDRNKSTRLLKPSQLSIMNKALVNINQYLLENKGMSLIERTLGKVQERDWAPFKDIVFRDAKLEPKFKYDYKVLDRMHYQVNQQRWVTTAPVIKDIIKDNLILDIMNSITYHMETKSGIRSDIKRPIIPLYMVNIIQTIQKENS